MQKSPLKTKTYLLAIEIVELYKYLSQVKYEFVMSKQLLRSGTNPGAMLREAQNSESKRDFVHKLKIAQKELGETQYWLELLNKTGFLDNTKIKLAESLSNEIMKMLRSAVMTAKRNLSYE